MQSNCIALEPREPEKGRNRTLNRASVNKHDRCLQQLVPPTVIPDARPLTTTAGLGPWMVIWWLWRATSGTRKACTAWVRVRA